MTYAAIEVSQDQGSPIELFEFKYSAKSWYYTSGNDEITYLGNVYRPLAGLYRGDYEETTDATRANMEIHLPRGTDIAKLFLIQPPSEVVTVTIFGQHLTDPNLQFVVIWKGRITNRELSGSEDVMTSESVFSSLLRPGLAPRYSRQCRVALYSEQCGVPRADFRVTGAVTAINKTTVVVPSLIGRDDGYFAGGMMNWVNSANGNTEKRGITSFDGTTGAVVLQSFPIGMAIGETVELFPGCDHLIVTCEGKYNNVANYRGEPYIPNKSPFGGTALF